MTRTLLLPPAVAALYLVVDEKGGHNDKGKGDKGWAKGKGDNNDVHTSTVSDIETDVHTSSSRAYSTAIAALSASNIESVDSSSSAASSIAGANAETDVDFSISDANSDWVFVE